jgi:small subunit ribosomal protein S2
MSTVTEKDLLQAACHLGHPRHKWNPKMASYIYGVQNKVHIFDLVQTKQALDEVCSILGKMQKEGQTVLFVSTKQQSITYIEMFREALGQPIVVRKWLPGLLTNWNTIKKRIKHYLDLQNSFKTGDIEKYTKKEQTQLRKELTKLDIALGGVSDMTGMPDAIFVIDAVRDRVAVLEARKLKIPVYGICDSNADPDLFTKCIPGNDDAVKSIELIMNTVLEAMGGTAPAEKKEVKEDSEE